MIDAQATLYGAFLLRVGLGAIYLAHSVMLKLLMLNLPGTAKVFETLASPGWTAYAMLAAEAIAVIRHSGDGRTKVLAEATAPGAARAPGTESILIPEAEARAAEPDRAGVIIFGTPTNMRSLSGRVKTFPE